MTKNVFATVAALSALTVGGPAAAQMAPATPVSFEVRAGAAVPVGNFAEEGVNTGSAQGGFSVGGRILLSPTPMVGLYGGYSFNRFNIDEEAAFGTTAVEGKYDEHGASAGVRLALPVPALSPYVQGGATYRKLERNVDGGSLGRVEEESDYELGFEVGAGLELPLGQRISVTPEVTYTRYNPGNNENSRVEFVRADVGLRIRI